MRFEVDAILFDIDGTLVDSTSAVHRAWTTLAGEYGMDPQTILSVCHGRRARDTLEDLFPPADHDAAEQRLHDLELADLSEVVALPNAVDVLTGLPRDRWAAVTSGDRELMTARLSAAQVPVPDVMVTSEEVTVGKPDPQGYRLGASRLGFDPTRCLVVEDAPAGLGAGSAAGAHVLAVATSHAADELRAHAHAVVEDLTAVTVTTGADGALVVEVREA